MKTNDFVVSVVVDELRFSDLQNFPVVAVILILVGCFVFYGLLVRHYRRVENLQK
jgi:hypothetical protein